MSIGIMPAAAFAMADNPKTHFGLMAMRHAAEPRAPKQRKPKYVPQPIVSHSREMPTWAKNNHKPNAAQYAELMHDAAVQAALKPLLNPFKLPPV